MNDKINRNRPVFRPQGEETESALDSSALPEESTPRVEDANGASGGPEPAEPEPQTAPRARRAESAPAETPSERFRPPRPARAETEEPPPTLAPAGRSAFASAGGSTRGRLRTVPGPEDAGAVRSGRERGERTERTGRTERAERPERARESSGRDRGTSASRTASPAPAPGTGGDTVPVMRSLDYDPRRARTGRATPGGRAPQRPGGGGRSTQLPRPRRHTVHTPGRFGFFGFVFGLIGLIIRMLIVTALVGGLVAVASYFAVQAYVKTTPVLVPNVRGMRIQEAFETLSQKKLAMIQERAEPSALVAPGEVIEQRPAPGTNTKEGTVVRLVVSSGKSNFVVPDVRGETRDTAVNKIRGAQLEVGNVTFLPDEKVPKDSVITQSPEPNKGLDHPTKVDLLISSGPAGSMLTMPDVTNMTVQEARSRLSELGVTDVTVEPAGAPASARVSAQEPLVGKMILQSQKVTLKTGR